MMQSKLGSDVDKLVLLINEVLKQFNTRERLSEFENGQVDGMLWTLQLIGEIKNPPSD
jgi:hypothetical protein